MLKIGIESVAYFGALDYEQGLKKAKEHGYDCVDYGEICVSNTPFYTYCDKEYIEYLNDVKSCADKYGIEFFQVHGSCPRTVGLKTYDKPSDNFIRQLKTCEKLGCKYLVIHPYTGDGTEDAKIIYDKNMEMLLTLIPYAKEYGVVICLENLPFRPLEISKSSTLKKLVSQLDSDYVKICFDTGHANVIGENIADTVLLLGKDLKVLHVHDNYGGADDRHYLPYHGSIDWDAFTDALNKIGYDGCLSLETVISIKTPEPAREQLQLGLSTLARELAKKVN